MATKTNLCGLDRSGIEQLMVQMDEKSFRGKQIYKWIYKNRAIAFEQMSDLKKELRSDLDRRFCIRLPELIASQKSVDGTEKFLMSGDMDHNGKNSRLQNQFEMVLIEDQDAPRTTLCISSQVGCPLNCGFCATGRIGFGRNLSVGEIVGQPLAIRQLYGDDAFDNLVFMGMGEPLLNFDKVMAAIDIMTDSLGLMLGARRITISTAGVVPGIKKLTQSGSKVNLAVSLNAADDTKRRQLMPITDAYSLNELLDAVKEWTLARKRRVTFEYILFKGINDSKEDALALADLIRGIACKINLLAYNLVDGVALQRPADEDIDRFAATLYPRAPAVTVRKSRGADVDAACGQLAGKKGYQ